MEDRKNEIVNQLFNEMVNANNRIDLNAYTKGLVDMYDRLLKKDIEELESQFYSEDAQEYYRDPEDTCISNVNN